MRSEETTYQYIIPLYNFAQTPYTFYLPKGYKRIKSVYAVPCKTTEDLTGVNTNLLELNIDGKDVLRLPLNVITKPDNKPLDFNELQLDYPISNGKVTVNHKSIMSSYLVFKLDNIEQYDLSRYDFKNFTTLFNFYYGSDNLKLTVVDKSLIESVWFNIININNKISTSAFVDENILNVFSQNALKAEFKNRAEDIRLLFYANSSNIPLKKTQRLFINANTLQINVRKLMTALPEDELDYLKNELLHVILKLQII